MRAGASGGSEALRLLRGDAIPCCCLPREASTADLFTSMSTEMSEPAPAAPPAADAGPASEAASHALLVLDLDGTLLETVEHGSCSEGPGDFSSASQGEGKAVTDTHLRPGLAAFISAVQAHGYLLAVWTAAPTVYAHAMIDGIERVAVAGFRQALGGRIFTDEHTTCSFHKGRMCRTKDLQKLEEHTGVPLHRCLVLDDTPETYVLNVRNAIPVEAWMAGYNDDEMLAEAATFLCSLDLSPAAVLDLSEWPYAPGGAGPLTEEAIREQTKKAKRSSMIGNGPPMPAWIGHGHTAEASDIAAAAAEIKIE